MEHVISIAIHPRTAADSAGLWAALPRLVDEDPTLAYRVDPDSEKAILTGASEIHLETAVDRLIRGFDVQVSVGDLRIAFRETITRTVEHDYTHKKQTGGAGQFARVKIRFEPLPRGSGFKFENEVIGGSVPREFVPGVEKGLRSALDVGVYAGYPTIDFRATLIDGAYHDTDSNAQTFETAASACFREAISKARPQLLEPIMKVTVVTPDEYMGDVIGDLNERGGAISCMSPGPVCAIDALVPLRYIIGYESHLRAMTKGRASWTTQFDHYAPYWGGDDLDPVHPGAAMGLR
jgi:elongation factor G